MIAGDSEPGSVTDAGNPDSPRTQTKRHWVPKAIPMLALGTSYDDIGQ